jgi:hypothetical protein
MGRFVMFFVVSFACVGCFAAHEVPVEGEPLHEPSCEAIESFSEGYCERTIGAGECELWREFAHAPGVEADGEWLAWASCVETGCDCDPEGDALVRVIERRYHGAE